MSLSSPKPTIPNELLYKIIIRVIADSIHSICLHPDDVEWEMDVVKTLCGVSFAFREIVTKLASKAFRVKLFDDASSGFPQIEKQFRGLRLLGTRLRRPRTYTSELEPCPDGSLLTLGYASFLAALNLRQNAIGVTVQVFLSTQKLILNVLTIALRLCASIKPPEIVDVLCDAIATEAELVRSGLVIVGGFMELNSLLDSLVSLQSSATANDIEVIHVRIHQELEKIENVYEIGPKSSVSKQGLNPAQLPGVLSTFKKLHAITLTVDEYGTSVRLDVLVKRWSMDCPFLHGTGP
ncbi:hypothetical protein Hypma_009268 [Hypsizygus marmoreus]|uniref:Uncharacterized protein n=1 Tax=Hypsizygus marmoreus TaxID=39966 RepID=A0A369JQD4_HYPMA|nr:hypothetical protein Hypma_009268 [Hypsizygus marmoreus]